MLVAVAVHFPKGLRRQVAGVSNLDGNVDLSLMLIVHGFIKAVDL